MDLTSHMWLLRAELQRIKDAHGHGLASEADPMAAPAVDAGLAILNEGGYFARTGTLPKMRAALEAVLLFHSGGPWTPEKTSEWFYLTQGGEATTKSLCDFVRAALAAETTFEAEVRKALLPAMRWFPADMPTLEIVAAVAEPYCRRDGGAMGRIIK